MKKIIGEKIRDILKDSKFNSNQEPCKFDEKGAGEDLNYYSSNSFNQSMTSCEINETNHFKSFTRS